MITEIEITVGDTGVALSGQLNGGGLSTLAGSTVTLSLLGVDADLRFTGRDALTNGAVTITDAAERRVSYDLQTADVARAGRYIMRWKVALPSSGGDVHIPGPKDDQVVLIINP